MMMAEEGVQGEGAIRTHGDATPMCRDFARALLTADLTKLQHKNRDLGINYAIALAELL
jgi:hypothetical protein